MQMTLVLEPIAQVGTEKIKTAHGLLEQFVYPEPSTEAKHFQQLRTVLGFSIMRASEILGLRPAEISNLEHGRARCAWHEAERLLIEAKVK